MLNFSLIGAGRIGNMHAKIIKAHPKSNLKYVYDVNSKLANDVVKLTGCEKAKSPEQAINSKDIDAVLIASATPTHTKFITTAAKAGKAIFCEKPIDLNIKKVNQCENNIKNYKVPIQIGFNRRFDLSHAKVQKACLNKEIGNLEMVVITSRDPQPPSMDYLKAAGGFFRDATIHDFDLTRFILGNDPVVQISAFGEALFDKNAKKIRDQDTGMFILKSKKGVLIHINNSRRAVYGYDQRVEIFGSKGMVISNNQVPNSVEKFTNKSTNIKDPIHFFFMERYEKAYKDQFNEFVKCVLKKTNPKVTFDDGKKALIIANAAYKSLKSGKVVNIKF